MKNLILGAPILFVLALILAWCVNVFKLVQCDFAAPWKGEVIHTIGVVIPPFAVVMVWFDDK